MKHLINLQQSLFECLNEGIYSIIQSQKTKHTIFLEGESRHEVQYNRFFSYIPIDKPIPQQPIQILWSARGLQNDTQGG